MRAPGRPLLLGLLLVLSAAGPGQGVAQTREAAETQTLLRLIAEVVQELKKFHAGESKRLQLLGPQQDPLRGGAGAAGAEEQRAAEIVPRDLRMKDKFLKHLTGPLYFSAKCSKHFHRLYHNTRDCTIPACSCLLIPLFANTIKDVPGFLPGWLSVHCAWRDEEEIDMDEVTVEKAVPPSAQVAAKGAEPKG
ncbi:hypothetical protein MC885_009067 [Smutsia gigantea]|nr:hypothetical protein MC885_009067 [Smutsia gigantea]